MLHKFYVGSRGSYACVRIHGQDKKDAIKRLTEMTHGEVPFVYFGEHAQTTDTNTVLDLEPSPSAYVKQSETSPQEISL